MSQTIKTKVQILFTLMLATLALAVLFFLFGTDFFPPPANAQEPDKPNNAPPFHLSEEILTKFGLTLADLRDISALNYTLDVTNQANSSSVNSGDPVTFTIKITNQGPDDAKWLVYYDTLPAELQNMNRDFSPNAGEIYDQQYAIWLLTNAIPQNETVMVTITGELVSSQNVSVKTVAGVHTFGASDKVEAEASVSIVNANPGPTGEVIFFPLIFKAPPPPPLTLAYHENFNDDSPDDNDWIEFDQDGCKTDIRDGRYWVDVEEDKTCLPPARNVNKPEKPYRTYGEFEVIAYHSEDLTGSGDLSNTPFGIFINGEGGDNYYLFRIWPNNSCSTGGNWELRQRWEDNNDDVHENILGSGSCHSAIKRGGKQNTLRIAHSNDKQLTVYIGDGNGNYTELGEFDGAKYKHLTGTSTGVYVRPSDEKVRIKFDDFKVYKYN